MSKENEIVVTDIQMPFISMVVFMVKWAIAAIPALFILAIMFSLFSQLMGNMMMSGQMNMSL